MYTILINEDKSLLTTVAPVLYQGEINQKILILLKEDWNGLNVEDVSIQCLYRDGDGNIETIDLIKTGEKMRDIYHTFYLSFSNEIMNKVASIPISFIVTEGEQVIKTATTYINIVKHPMGFDEPTEDNVIYITRGDSKTVTLSLYNEYNSPFTPETTDTIKFRVKKTASSPDILIQKDIDVNSLEMIFVENDTKYLDFGEYKYEVEIVTSSYDHYTVIKNATFIIGEELENHGENNH